MMERYFDILTPCQKNMGIAGNPLYSSIFVTGSVAE
jgi:hypothetical protein